MNEKVSPYLLEGMKLVVREQWVSLSLSLSFLTLLDSFGSFLADDVLIRPSNPLRFLGEYLIQKSGEVEP
jgi:hypothetical protein